MSSVVNRHARPVTPLGILVEQLEKTVRLVEQSASVPTEIAASLQHAFRLAAGLDPYLTSNDESPALAVIAKKTNEETWSQRFSDGSTVRHLEQEMLSGHRGAGTQDVCPHDTRSKCVGHWDVHWVLSPGDGRGFTQKLG